jgi:hypothetical protein
MTGTSLKIEIIESIMKTEDDGLLFEIKSLIEEDTDHEPLSKSAEILGPVDWEELEEQLKDVNEPEYTWETLVNEIKKSRK